MAAFMKPYAPQLYAAMRILFGLLFLSHGLGKLVGWPVAVPPEASALVVYGAGTIEAVTGALVAMGLFTRWAAFLAAGQMAAAYWIAHGLRHFHPLVNQGELAALYCFAFLFICAHGPGIWSADAARGRS